VNVQHTPEELADIRRIYRTITRKRTPADADGPLVFSCRVLSGYQGVQEQLKWKKKVKTLRIHEDWASWTYLSGQAMHEDIERGLAETEGIRSSEEYISEEYEGGIKVWSSLDVSAEGEIIQVKTSELADPAIFRSFVLQAGWEAMVFEKRTGKKVKAKVWKIYRNAGSTVGVNVHTLTEEEKAAGYDEVVSRAKQCARLVNDWLFAKLTAPERVAAK
jgi:hypothetical protein